jgi:hypothetical protein
VQGDVITIFNSVMLGADKGKDIEARPNPCFQSCGSWFCGLTLVCVWWQEQMSFSFGVVTPMFSPAEARRVRTSCLGCVAVA